jgi:hypothetical protein
MAKKRRVDKATAVESEWINSLVKQTAAEDSGTTQPKEKRIEKRLAKRRRREDRQSSSRAERPSTHQSVASSRSCGNKEGSDLRRNQGLLHKLTCAIQAVVDAHSGSSLRPFASDGVTIYKKRKWEASSIQPRRNDYGGIGVARPTLFLEMEDPSFQAKLNEEFSQHIPGFFGKQRTNAMKKQLNNNMLWKQMSTKRDMKVNGRKLADMKPDEQVEAMIKAGML